MQTHLLGFTGKAVMDEPLRPRYRGATLADCTALEGNWYTYDKTTREDRLTRTKIRIPSLPLLLSYTTSIPSTSFRHLGQTDTVSMARGSILWRLDQRNLSLVCNIFIILSCFSSHSSHRGISSCPCYHRCYRRGWVMCSDRPWTLWQVRDSSISWIFANNRLEPAR